MRARVGVFASSSIAVAVATQGGDVPDVWSLQHPVPTTLAMGVLLIAVFVPLPVRMYTRRAR